MEGALNQYDAGTLKIASFEVTGFFLDILCKCSYVCMFFFLCYPGADLKQHGEVKTWHSSRMAISRGRNKQTNKQTNERTNKQTNKQTNHVPRPQNPTIIKHSPNACRCFPIKALTEACKIASIAWRSMGFWKVAPLLTKLHRFFAKNCHCQQKVYV